MPITTEVTKYRKVGDAFGFVLPKAVREVLGWFPGDLLLIRIINKKIVVGKIDPGKAMPLSQAEYDAVRVGDAREK